MFKFTRLSKRIRSVSVDRSELEGHDIDIRLNFNGTKKSIGLAMPIDEAVIFRDELNKLIEEVGHEQ